MQLRRGDDWLPYALLLAKAEGRDLREVRMPQGSAWLTGHGANFTLTAGQRKVIQAITLRYFVGERIRATTEIVYHAARSAFAVADDAGINSVATYLWAIGDGYGTGRLSEMASALVRAAVDHDLQVSTLRRERRPQSW